MEKEKINIMNYRYERSQDQLQTISRFIHIYLCVLGIAGMLVLFGVMQIHLRDRKSEIAIFMSLGVKKAYIILQAYYRKHNIVFSFLGCCLNDDFRAMCCNKQIPDRFSVFIDISRGLPFWYGWALCYINSNANFTYLYCTR